ncbi:Apolipophorin [Merluccius polli]|uniref:Apolipophorin n=1 Tax=Merluccius polli TaxID=89951 RepID=A0AA47M051_MERPO|nr:Apolipophorin [Merluccius polli]
MGKLTGMEVKTSCPAAATADREPLVAVRRSAHTVEVSNQNGVSVSCDLSLDLCSLTLDGWLHGTSVGLLGTNDNEGGNDSPLPHGSQAASRAHFLRSWQISSNCSRAPDPPEGCSGAALQGPAGCQTLFSSPHSPLSSCFRVVDPGQFLSVCKKSHCGSPRVPMVRSSCRLAAAFVHLCQRNHVPLDLPCIHEGERSGDHLYRG